MARTICRQMIDASPKRVHINQIPKHSAPEKGVIDPPPGQTTRAAQGTSIAWQSLKPEPTEHTMELKPRIRPALATARADWEATWN
ncbi:MAG: hypothetical protein O9318_14630 [Hylemonella sp.]|nr:hypothetical protein [Hylemonella sp.]